MKKTVNSMKNIGKGIGNFITNPNAVRSAMGVPASEQTVDVKAYQSRIRTYSKSKSSTTTRSCSKSSSTYQEKER